jgi:methylmalonyl-CoA mutase cobalamin-binding subunit
MREDLRPLAIVATTADDSHIWNLVGVELKLRDRGYQVKNLGACTPATEIAEAVRSHRPVLLAISTINGHGALSIAPILETLQDYQLKRAVKIVIGGLLTIDPAVAPSVAQRLLDQGADAVLTGDDAWQRFDSMFASHPQWPQADSSAPADHPTCNKEYDDAY